MAKPPLAAACRVFGLLKLETASRTGGDRGSDPRGQTGWWWPIRQPATQMNQVVTALTSLLALAQIAVDDAPVPRVKSPVRLSDWMRDMIDDIGDMALRDIAIAGSHNSGSYAIDPRSKRLSGDFEGQYKGLKPFVEHQTPLAAVVSKFAKVPLVHVAADQPFNYVVLQCQRNPILHQLENGVRYLDVRMHYEYLGRDSVGTLELCHSLCAIDYKVFARQVVQFVEAHPGEVVIVDVNHVYAEGAHIDDCKDQILEMIVDSLGRTRIADSTLSPESPLRDFVNHRRNIVLVYQYASSAARSNIWAGNAIQSRWTESRNDQDILDRGFRQVIDRDRYSLHVMQLVVAYGADEILNGLTMDDAPCSTLVMGRNLTSTVPSFILGHCESGSTFLRNVNIVMVDDSSLNGHALAMALLSVNFMKSRLPKPRR